MVSIIWPCCNGLNRHQSDCPNRAQERVVAGVIYRQCCGGVELHKSNCPTRAAKESERNPAMQVRDLLVNKRYGLGLPLTKIDEASFAEASFAVDSSVCSRCGLVGKHATDCPSRRAVMPWGSKPDQAAQEKGKALRSVLIKRVEEMWLFRDALSGFQRKFLADMRERIKVPGFFPSAKQTEVLIRITADLDRARLFLRGKKEPVGKSNVPFMPEMGMRRRLRIGEEG